MLLAVLNVVQGQKTKSSSQKGVANNRERIGKGFWWRGKSSSREVRKVARTDKSKGKGETK